MSDSIDGEAIDSATSTYHRTSTTIENTLSNNDASPTPLRNSSRAGPVSAQNLSYTERAEQPYQRCGDEYRTLILMPRLREIDLRPGRKIYQGAKCRNDAALGQTRGNIAGSPCDGCLRGRKGPFASCVVVPGMFEGGCCNCHYSVRRRKCSFRQGMSLQM